MQVFKNVKQQNQRGIIARVQRGKKSLDREAGEENYMQRNTMAHKLSPCMISVGMQFSNILLDYTSATNKCE